jgi:hypothetical protein
MNFIVPVYNTNPSPNPSAQQLFEKMMPQQAVLA